MKKTAAGRLFFSVVDGLAVEDPRALPSDAARCEDEACAPTSELRLPSGVTSLQHWLDLNG